MSLVKRLTSPFYASGAQVLGSTDNVDEALARGAAASFAGGVVVITYPDGTEHFQQAGLGDKRRLAEWCNKFNERSAQPNPNTVGLG